MADHWRGSLIPPPHPLASTPTQVLTRLITGAGLPLDRETFMLQTMGEMQSHAGTCTRVHTQPPPVSINVQSTGFIQVWGKGVDGGVEGGVKDREEMHWGVH